MIYVEDCLNTLDRKLYYDYVVCSPPDFDELDKAIDFSYADFIKSWAAKLEPANNFVSICISDRKSGGQIVINGVDGLNLWKITTYKLGYK